jgi:hypothetical protein
LIVLELTDEEALNLRNLLDAAVRSYGMRAAEAAMPIDQKIMIAAQKAQQQQMVQAQPTHMGNGSERTS